MKRFILLLVLLSIPISIAAQTPRIGLYTDVEGSTSTAFVEPYVPFNVYLIVSPGNNGFFCAEYALDLDPDLVITGSSANPDVTVEMGSFSSGISTCMSECNEAGTLLTTISMISTTSAPSEIRVVRHPEAGYHQVANCLDMRDIEPAFAYPPVCVNKVCEWDNEPPAVTGVTVLSETEIILQLSERVFLPDVRNLSNYRVYFRGDHSVTLRVLAVALRGDDNRIWMLLGSSPGEETCVVELSGLRDMAGNMIPSGTQVIFNEADAVPPYIRYAWAVDDSTVSVIFDDRVASGPASDQANYQLTVLSSGLAVPVINAQLEGDGATAVLHLSGPMERGVVHKVTANGISDLSGNVKTETSRGFMSIDDVPPMLASVSVEAETCVLVAYNEAMDLSSAGDPMHYSIYRSDDPDSISSIETVSATGDSILLLHFEAGLESETLYSLAVSGVMDSSMNVISPATFEFSYPDTVPPLLIQALPIDGSTVDLQFDEELDPVSVADTGNYTLHAVSTPGVMMRIDSAELMPDASIVRLHLGDQMVSRWNYAVVVSNMADVRGNTMRVEQGGHFLFIERVPPEVTGAGVKSEGVLRIDFNEPLDHDSACEPANYEIFEEGDTTALLNIVSADLELGPGTVSVRVEDAFSDSGSYVIRITGVEDLSGNPIAPGTSRTFSGRDEMQPELARYQIVGERAMVLTFDEPMNEASVTDTDLYAIYVSGDPADEMDIGSLSMLDERTVRLEIAALPVLEQPYTLRIVNVMDMAANVVVPIYVEFVFEDTFPPELTGAVSLAERAVRLEFNEVLDAGIAAAPGHYGIYPAGSPSAGLPVVSAERVDGGNAVIVHLGATLVQGIWTASVTGVSDIYGNTILDAQTAQFPFVDLSAPFVTGIEVEHMLEVHVAFNEPLDMAGPDDASNYTFFEAGDTSVRFNAETAGIGAGQDEVTLKPARQLTPGLQYLLRVTGVSDLVGNWIDSETLFGFTAEDGKPPELAGYVTSGDSMITISFSEPLDSASIVVPGCIMIYESLNPSTVLAINSIEVAGEGLVANVTLLDHASEGMPYTLEIQGPADLAGNAIVPVLEEYIYFGDFEDRPHAISAEAVGHDEVVVRFDRQLDSFTARIPSNYYLFTTVDTTSIRYITSVRLLPDGSSVHLNVDRTFLNDLHLTLRISNVRDIYGNTIADGSEVQFYYTDHFAPGFDAASYLSDRRIRVVFDELADSATASAPANYNVYRPDHPEMTIPVDHVEFLGWSVVLNTAEPMSFEPIYLGSESDVDSLASGEERDMLTCFWTRYAIACDGVEDYFGNAMRPENTIEFIFWDSYPPDLLSIRVLTPSSIYVSFSEVMSATYVTDTGRYSLRRAGGTLPAVTVGSAEYLGKHVVLHLASPLAAGDYELVMSGVRDQAGNAVSAEPAPFTFTGAPAGAVVGLYADGERSGGAVNVEGAGEPFSFYVWCRGSEFEMSAVRYAISSSGLWAMTGMAANDAVVIDDSGYPVGQGMIVTLDGCQDGWIWTHRIDCVSLAEGEESIMVLPAFPAGQLGITNCLYGGPAESAAGESLYLFIDSPLATMLERWDVEYRNGAIEVSWSISAVDEPPTFSVMRRAEGGGDPVELPAGAIIRDGLSFRSFDTGFQHGSSYVYRVTMDEDGGDVILFETGAIETPELPFTLRQNVPNPFNPSTEIFYHLTERCAVSLDVYDVAGRHIVRLAGGTQAEGDHSVTWNGTDGGGSRVGSGVYFYSLRAGKNELTRKMIMLR